MIHIPSSELDAILREARSSYPEECCGALLGSARGPHERDVVRAVPIANAKRDQRERRYLIGPDDVLKVEQAAAGAGLDVLGYYHSHPDHPATPSGFDREHAWPWYTYVIVPVRAGEAGVPRAWQLAADRVEFDEIEIASKEPT